MPGVLKLGFAPFSTPAKGVLVLFCEEGLKFGSAARKALDPTGDWSPGRRQPTGSRARTARRSTWWRRPGSTCRVWSSWAWARRATSRPGTS